MVRIYTKSPGKSPDMGRPFTLRRGQTVLDLAGLVHKDIAHGFKYARLWGDGSFEGQQVGRDHIVADGDVIELSLHTIKVQNWDKTISTIPTQALISHSFKNWRGMEESGGRRIKRALYIDMSTIAFCDEETLGQFEKFEYMKDYLRGKQAEIDEYNRQAGADTSQPINGRRLTNIGTFRAYVEEYLHKHPKIHKDMTFLVRQLAPTERGLPIEIYVFSNDQVWANYEALQADIFDHILAVVPLFGLRVYQSPSANDLRGAAEIIASSRGMGDEVP